MPDFPRTTATVDPATIWNYSVRTLTSLDNLGYTAERAQKLDNLDVPVSTRSSHTVADIWSYSTRELTRITGQPRIDLMGEDASFEEGTGNRKWYIDRIPDIFGIKDFNYGSVQMDGSEQELIVAGGQIYPLARLYAYLDLSQLQDGDTLVVRQYIKITPEGDYLKYAEETFYGVQSLPLLHILSKWFTYGIKLTVQQTSGTYRTITYSYMIESSL